MTYFKHTSHSTPDDEVILSQYRKSGDIRLLASLYHRYKGLVYAVCLKYLKDPESSKDEVMNIFEDLVTKLKKHQIDHFRPWLHTMVRNHCLMKLRSQKRFRTTELQPDHMQSVEEMHLNGMLEKEENLKQLANCLDTLSEQQRVAVTLFYLEGKCYKEISEKTGMDWNQVRSHIQNARRNLKICMEKETVRDQTPWS